MEQILTFTRDFLATFARCATALEQIAQRSQQQPAPQPEPEPTPAPQPEPEPEQPEPEQPEEPAPVEPQPTPEPEQPEAPALPEGMIRVADIPLMSDNWKKGNLVLPYWSGANPALVDFQEDGSAIVTARTIGGSWNKGLLQTFRPTPGTGRFAALMSVDNPIGVAAFFLYAHETPDKQPDGTEFDFELVKRPDGSLAWQVNVHMFDANRRRRNPARLIYVPTTPERLVVPALYEIDVSADGVRFLIDGEEVGRYTPADVAAPWKSDATLGAFIGTYDHTGWSGWNRSDYANNDAQITAYGLQVPGLSV
ncbi:MAG: hypothetical protein ACU0DJ_14905 [Paracoccus sp. (in: a-proteobacteria)]